MLLATIRTAAGQSNTASERGEVLNRASELELAIKPSSPDVRGGV